MDASVSLADAYGQIYRWYSADTSLVLLNQRPESDYRERSRRLIANLPEPGRASDAEMRAVMQEVRAGLLEWAYQQRSGDRMNGEIAGEVLEATGGGLSKEELLELSSESPLWAFLSSGSALAMLNESLALRDNGRVEEADVVLDKAAIEAGHDPVTGARIAIARATVAKDRYRFPEARQIAKAGLSLAGAATPNVRGALRDQLSALIATSRGPATPSSETPSRVPFDLARYQLSPGASNILMNAAKRLAPEEAVSTSLVLIEAIEQGRPGVDAYWIADFLRQSVANYAKKYGEVRGPYLERQPKQPGRSSAQYMTAGLAFALTRAEDFARRTTDGLQIAGRHLIAALLVDPPAPHRLGSAKRLQEIGLDVPLVRERLYEWLRGYGDKDDVWRIILVGSETPPRRLAEFHADHTRGPDLLNIEQDVVALATLVAARAVAPPLSIGLFGDWGSGKTFFMRQLRYTVALLSKEARDDKQTRQRELPFYKRIVQIEFNAWHYVEGNLWASLVEHIFDNLHVPEDSKLNVVEAMQKHWIAKLGFSEMAETEAARRENEAAARVVDAQTAVTKVQETYDAKKEELQKLSAKNVARDFKLAGAFDVVVTALEPLGLKPLSAAVTDLQSSLRQARSVVERGNAAITPLLHAEDKADRWRSLVIILIGAPVAAVAVGALLTMIGAERIGQISALATGAATFLGFGARWLRAQATWMSERLEQVEGANKKYDEALAKEQAAMAHDIARTEQELALARQDYSAAQQRVEQARREKDAVQTELTRTTSARLLARFIEDRASSSDYRKHLGVLALVRDDFEKLSELIEVENWQLSPEDVREERFDGRLKKFADLAEEEKEAANRINRIVLYIDDLDRCPPAKVVDVLQAVHLLLAFPLFVVVVGVDARWVSRSLETRYREMLHVGASDAAVQLNNMFGVVRSEDYLEKIFQIPLWLRPMGAGNVRYMVQGLLRPGSRTQPAQGDGKPGVGREIGDGRQAGSDAAAGGRESTTETGDKARSGGDAGGRNTEQHATADAPRRPNLESLDVREIELQTIDDLSPLLGRSPRALKRFVNIYRLIKARLTPLEHNAFMRHNDQACSEFEAVLWLLAVDTGLPRISRTVFDVLAHSGSNDDEPVRSRSKRAAGRGVNDFKSLVSALDKKIGADTSEWATLKAWLTERQEYPRLATGIPELVRWVPTVSRYSFQAAQIEARQ